MQSAKNVAASAKAGMEKTKANLQEKAEKMTTRDPLQKEMAAQKKGERVQQADLQKQQERAHGGVGLGTGGTTTGGYPAGTETGIPPTAAVYEGEEYPQGMGRQAGLGSNTTGYGSGSTI